VRRSALVLTVLYFLVAGEAVCSCPHGFVLLGGFCSTIGRPCLRDGDCYPSGSLFCHHSHGHSRCAVNRCALEPNLCGDSGVAVCLPTGPDESRCEPAPLCTTTCPSFANSADGGSGLVLACCQAGRCMPIGGTTCRNGAGQCHQCVPAGDHCNVNGECACGELDSACRSPSQCQRRKCCSSSTCHETSDCCSGLLCLNGACQEVTTPPACTSVVSITVPDGETSMATVTYSPGSTCGIPGLTLYYVPTVGGAVPIPTVCTPCPLLSQGGVADCLIPPIAPNIDHVAGVLTCENSACNSALTVNTVVVVSLVGVPFDQP